MRIAVVGAGLFGLTAAYFLSKKHIVDIFERQPDVLMAASGINQFRLHKGYHYPRSPETVQSNIKSSASFKREFGDAIIDNFNHYYCIAKEKTLTSSSDYMSFCINNNLKFKKVNLKLLNKESISACLRVDEQLIDLKKLKTNLLNKLNKSNIQLFLNKNVSVHDLKQYDKIVVSTYSNINSFLKNNERNLYQYEVCEKIVVKMPSSFRKKSIVIMDGPFMCIDPFGNSDLFLLGNVVHAIHSSNVGYFPIINGKYKGLLNKGIITSPPFTNFNKFLKSMTKFIPDARHAKYMGSMFTVRTVLPNKESTDERPTLVTQINDRIITVFSGKLGSSVVAANQVESLIG